MAPLLFQGVDKLPNEVAEFICDAAAGDVEVSKNLRLTARKFYARATVHTFAGLVVHQHPDSYEKVNLIAQDPKLAPLVRTLYLTGETPLVDYNDVKWLLIKLKEDDLHSWLRDYLFEHPEVKASIVEE